MTDSIREYLNKVQWSTVTRLSDKFNITRQDVDTALVKMLENQDVRVYDGEIVHV